MSVQLSFPKNRVKKVQSSTTPKHGYKNTENDNVSGQIQGVREELAANSHDENNLQSDSSVELEHACGTPQYPAICSSINNTCAGQAPMNPPVLQALSVTPNYCLHGAVLPPDPIAMMEYLNHTTKVTKEFQKNQKELCRNAIISAKQAVLGQTHILPLQAGSPDQRADLRVPCLIANTTQSLHQLTGFASFGLVLGVLAGISIATQGRVKVKLTSHWFEPAIDMVMNISESGTMKSSVVDILTQPFAEYAKKINEGRSAGRKSKSIVAKLAQKAADRMARNRIKTALDNGSDIATAIEEAAQKKKAILAPYEGLDRPDVILLISKGTPHQVAKRLQDQGMCQGCITDEGDMLRSGLLGKRGDPELFLKGHTQGEYAYPATSGAIHVRPSLPMIHFVTPAVSAALYASEAKNGVEGVTARFVPYFAAGGGGGSTFVPDTAFAEYYSLISELLDTYHTQEAGAEKYEVDVTPEAVDLLYSFKAEIQESVIPNMPEAAVPYLRKAHGQAARFAWDIHAAEMGSMKCKPHLCPIQASTMQQAIAIVWLTFEHIRWIYDPCGFPAYNLGKEVVKSLLRISQEEWQNVLINGIDSTTLQQRVGTKSAEMNNALRFLERHNVLAVYDEGTRNLKVVLNPWFFRANWRELGVSHG